MPKGRKIRKRVRQPAEPSLFIWILLGFVVFALIIGSSFMTFLSQRNWVLPWGKTPASDYKTVTSTPASKEIAPEFRKRTSTTSLTDTSTALGLVAAYVRHNGGKDTLEPLKTILIKGNLTYDGHIFDFEMFKKEPDKLRIQLQDKKGLLIIASNGNQTWEGFRQTGGTLHWWPLSSDTADWLWLQSPLGGRLLQPATPEIHLLLGATETSSTGGHSLQPLSINSTGNRKIVYYLDANEYLLRRLDLFDKDMPTPTQSAEFGNISLESNVWMPHAITSVNAQGVKTTLQISKIAFNTGVLNDLFNPPTVGEATQPSITTSQTANSPPDLSTYGFPWALPW